MWQSLFGSASYFHSYQNNNHQGSSLGTQIRNGRGKLADWDYFERFLLLFHFRDIDLCPSFMLKKGDVLTIQLFLYKRDCIKIMLNSYNNLTLSTIPRHCFFLDNSMTFCERFLWYFCIKVPYNVKHRVIV